MGTTPHAIRTVELSRCAFGGYRRSEVETVLDDTADSLATVLRERDELRKRIETLEAEAQSHAELETMLRSTLVSAENASQEAKHQARRESDLIVQEAHAEARRVTREAAAERRRLEEDAIGIQARLRMALDLLGAPASAQPATEQQPPKQPGTPIDEDLENRLREVIA
jgi:cell division initiation protein